MTEEFIEIVGPSPQQAHPVSMRCPKCHREGIFAPVTKLQDLAINGGRRLGHRQCPLATCRTHVFVVLTPKHELQASFPAERVAFDASSIPGAITAVFGEALTCYANKCFIAAGMLVRKTLEILCQDKGATGANLFQRLQALRGQVILPEALFTALQELRLLGNDAAHVDAVTFEQVGREELDLAITLTQEILKAVYQYNDLLDRLGKLKKT